MNKPRPLHQKILSLKNCKIVFNIICVPIFHIEFLNVLTKYSFCKAVISYCIVTSAILYAAPWEVESRHKSPSGVRVSQIGGLIAPHK